VVAYAIRSDLNLYSDFTYFLDDPVRGDQFQQADHRFVIGARAGQQRIGQWRGHDVQNTFGVQFRQDDIPTVGLYHTQARRRLEIVREDAVAETSAAAYVQNETVWTPWLRTLAGLRVDGYRFRVDADDPRNSGKRYAGLASPKAGLVIGPFRGTEIYGNAGIGFHSNDARGTTITRDPVTGQPVVPVTPLARAVGAEAGLRTVAVPRLQTTFTLWTLSLDSELLFVGDAGTTEPSRPSHRYGFELANYYAPRPWLILDGDLTWSSARFTDANPAGAFIPGAANTVASAGVTLDAWRRVVGSARLRYFGPRPLLEDNSVRSKATSLVNVQAGYRLTKRVRAIVDVFNVFDARDSDVDYFYTSRLPGEPLSGVDDIHLHPTLPRTARVSLVLGF
jgi:outer membrane receptor protein involved in Fe transport